MYSLTIILTRQPATWNESVTSTDYVISSSQDYRIIQFHHRLEIFSLTLPNFSSMISVSKIFSKAIPEPIYTVSPHKYYAKSSLIAFFFYREESHILIRGLQKFSTLKLIRSYSRNQAPPVTQSLLRFKFVKKKKISPLDIYINQKASGNFLQ